MDIGTGNGKPITGPSWIELSQAGVSVLDVGQGLP